MRKTKQKFHPFEDEYIIYHCGTRGYEDEGCALALYILGGRRMQEVTMPIDHVMQPSDIGERNIDGLLQLIEKNNINKIYFVWHLGDFFWIPPSFISLHESNTELEEIELWSEWKQIENGGSEYERLKKGY